LIAKSQITSQLPAIPPQIEPIPPDVPEVGTNVRAKKRAASEAAAKGPTRKEWPTSEAAAKATASKRWPTCESAVKAAAHAAEASIAAKGRGIGCVHGGTQSSCGSKREN
jgi:hypothetical protein